ncbi:MAG: 50S ribosomal protein L31 [Parcubacteria group bacterium GW2011_GWC2_38_7]|nr:MAG: 50S ribosomal protein L31 [Parcubacteria group bacterium GW2011_GWC2_38_7]
MKKDIHPKYQKDAKIICVCGNQFTTGSTMPEIKVEICHLCHPFYTGKQNLVDTARRIEKFKARLDKKDESATASKGKKAKRVAKAEKKATKVNK